MTTPEPVSPAPDTDSGQPEDLHARLLALVPYMSRRVPPATTDNLLDQVASDIGHARRVRELLLGALAALVAPLGITREQVESSPHGEAIRARDQISGLRADLDQARHEQETTSVLLGRALDQLNAKRDEVARLTKVYDRTHEALRGLLPKPGVTDSSLDDVPIGQLVILLARQLARAGARTIPDDAAERLKKFVTDLQAAEAPGEPDRSESAAAYDAGFRDATVQAGNDLEMLLADLGATPTTDPAPEPPQSPPNPRPDLPECGATEGGMGVDCHLPAGHTCWHAAHHTPREDGTESIGYPFDIQWPRNEWDHCPPAAPHALAEPTEETAFGALLAAAGDLDGGTDADRRLAEHIRSAVAEVAREDAATPPLPLQDQADLLTWRVVHVPPGTTDREDTDTPITPGWWLVGHGDDPDHPDVQVHLGDRLPTSSAANPGDEYNDNLGGWVRPTPIQPEEA